MTISYLNIKCTNLVLKKLSEFGKHFDIVRFHRRTSPIYKNLTSKNLDVNYIHFFTEIQTFYFRKILLVTDQCFQRHIITFTNRRIICTVAKIKNSLLTLSSINFQKSTIT